jgi:hypothetical protein
VLQLPKGATIVERSLPEGYAVREADPAEYTTAHDVKEDASRRTRRSLSMLADMVTTSGRGNCAAPQASCPAPVPPRDHGPEGTARRAADKYFVLLRAQRASVYVVDVHAGRQVFLVAGLASMSAADKAQLKAALDSIRIEG